MGLRLYTGGTFDLFHAGHVEFLKRCKEIADTVTVSLNSDQFIEKYKGKPPVMRYRERREVLNACKYVDAPTPPPSPWRHKRAPDQPRAPSRRYAGG